MPFRVLNVAEKNDAAKELSRIMSRGNSSRREGYSKFNKIYEFDYHILNNNAKMVMTSVSGHLMEMDFTASHSKWYSCSPVALFAAPVVKFVGENYQPIKRTLEREVRGAQALVVWTDCDREGENIGFEIIDVCCKIRPNIRVYRARFSEITPQSVERACQNLQQPDRLMSEAVDTRSELDLRIGAAFTRFQTLRLQKVFPQDLREQLISYGSCQFPTLGFVVERYKQVQHFVPETFYKIKVSHETADGRIDFNWKRVRLFHHTACLVLYQMCLENPIARVMQTSSRPKSKWRPLPLDTVELEKLASRKLHISAKETMRIAEKLYTNGFISYPRTETNVFPSSLDLRPLVQNQTVDQNWGGFAADVLARGPQPRAGNKTDNAHPPIHPTKYTAGLQGNEQRVYEFVVRHFLACCSQDAQGRETSVDIEIAGEQFTATGLMIIARNYLDVYPYDRWNAKIIPVYEQGEEFQPTSIEMVEGETNPPPLLTEADLIALMEKHGIGTDATHAEHIETIKTRSYVGVQQDGTLLPGQLGMGLVEGYDLMGFEMSKPRLRAELEADLRKICEGRKSKEEVLAEQIQKYRENFVQAVQEAVKLDQALSEYFGDPQEFIAEVLDMERIYSEPARLCPRCEVEQMMLKKTKEGSYIIGCAGYPRCRACIFLPKFVLEASVQEEVCPRCRPGDVHTIRFKFKRGSVPPGMAEEYVGCVGGCDELLREVLDLKDLKRVPTSESGRGGTSRPNTGRGGSAVSRPSRGRGGAARGAGPRGRGGGPPPSGGFGPSRGGVGHSRGGFGPADRGFGHSRGGFGPSGGRAGQGAQSNVSFNSFSGGGFAPNLADSENCVVCICGDAAVKLTVRKEGPNTGRQFFKCSKREGGCDFFLWADAEQGGNSGAPRNARAPLRGSGSFNSNTPAGGSWQGGDSFTSRSSDEDTPPCQCGNPSVRRTVSKEGPNKGRPFLCCGKPIGQSCKFFEWADAAAPPPQGSGRGRSAGAGGGWGGANRGRGGQGPTRKGTKRKCSSCRQEGHTKNTCPMSR